MRRLGRCSGVPSPQSQQGRADRPVSLSPFASLASPFSFLGPVLPAVARGVILAGGAGDGFPAARGVSVASAPLEEETHAVLAGAQSGRSRPPRTHCRGSGLEPSAFLSPTGSPLPGASPLGRAPPSPCRAPPASQVCESGVLGEAASLPLPHPVPAPPFLGSFSFLTGVSAQSWWVLSRGPYIPLFVGCLFPCHPLCVSPSVFPPLPHL